jgi:hypothetical protein
MSLTEFAFIIASQDAMGIAVSASYIIFRIADENNLLQAQPILSQPVEQLSDTIQKASRGFYDVHSLLMRKKSTKALEQLRSSKALFRSEFQTIHQALQSSYRHIIDFTSSCKRVPDERGVSAQRCQRSGKSILRDLQEVTRTFEAMCEGFEGQKPVLSGISISAFKHSMKGAQVRGVFSIHCGIHYPYLQASHRLMGNLIYLIRRMKIPSLFYTRLSKKFCLPSKNSSSSGTATFPSSTSCSTGRRTIPLLEKRQGLQSRRGSTTKRSS